MEPPLDNPVWHALIGPHANLAIGHGFARHYPRDVALFSAIASATEAAYDDLAAALPLGIEARLFRPAEEPSPPGWETIFSKPIIQMVADDVAALGVAPQRAPIALGPGDAQDMLRLAEMARPGPFEPRTPILGGYLGYRCRGELVAMGGTRFRLPGFVELSAICVQPHMRGRGFGTDMTLHLPGRHCRGGDSLPACLSRQPGRRDVSVPGFPRTRQAMGRLATARVLIRCPPLFATPSSSDGRS